MESGSRTGRWAEGVANKTRDYITDISVCWVSCQKTFNRKVVKVKNKKKKPLWVRLPYNSPIKHNVTFKVSLEDYKI